MKNKINNDIKWVSFMFAGFLPLTAKKKEKKRKKLK